MRMRGRAKDCGNPACPVHCSRRGRIMSRISGRCLACPHELSTKSQKRSHSLTWLCRQEACLDRIFLPLVVVLWEGLDVLPLAMRRIIVAVDRTIHMPTIPMVGKSAWLDL